MTAPVEARRPPVMSAALSRHLQDYLRFRDVFLDHGGFDLGWERCRELLASLPSLTERLAAEMRLFEDFLRAAGVQE